MSFQRDEDFKKSGSAKGEDKNHIKKDFIRAMRYRLFFFAECDSDWRRMTAASLQRSSYLSMAA